MARVLGAMCLGVVLLAPPASGDDGIGARSLPNLVPRPPDVTLGAADAGTGSQAIRLETPMANISRGWRDTYTYSTQGQQVVVDDVTPGIYALVVTVDPDDLIFETSNEDNTVVTMVKLTADAVTDLCVFNRSLSRCA